MTRARRDPALDRRKKELFMTSEGVGIKIRMNTSRVTWE